MMGRALLTVGWLATLGFIAAGVGGYWVEGKEGLGNHQLLGLASAVLLLFSHSWIMFYLIGTGKQVKDAVAEHGVDPQKIEETKTYKSRSYPPLMLAIGLAMATFILGGGVDTGVLPPWVHHGLFWATLAAQLRALLIEHRVLAANERLLDGIRRELAGR